MSRSTDFVKVIRDLDSTHHAYFNTTIIIYASCVKHVILTLNTNITIVQVF